MRERFLIIGFAIIVLCSRLPFLNAGYGNDPDAWRIANTARYIAATGEYVASRLPGNPLPEIVYSLIWKGGPFALNGMAAFVSVAGSMFFVLTLRVLKSKDFILGGLALAFSPIIFINSTNCMDYIWGLTFILASFYFILIDKTVVAAAFLGFAIESRITSGAMLLPLSLVIIHQEGKLNISSLIKFASVACVTGTILFTPVILRYGFGFLTFSEKNSTSLLVVYNASVGVWGTVGVLALVMILVIQAIRMRWSIGRRVGLVYTQEKLLITASVLAIGLYLIAFLRLPAESGYLIPIIPFVIFLLSRFLERPLYIVICIAIIFSSFLITIKKDKITLVGPIFHDYQTRVENIAYVERSQLVIDGLEHKSLIVAGSWLPQMTALMPPHRNELVEYIYLVNETDLQSYLERGFWIYYLSGQRELTIRKYGFDLEEIGARPLLP